MLLYRIQTLFEGKEQRVSIDTKEDGTQPLYGSKVAAEQALEDILRRNPAQACYAFNVVPVEARWGLGARVEGGVPGARRFTGNVARVRLSLEGNLFVLVAWDGGGTTWVYEDDLREVDEAPELTEDFFKNPILTRPGESLIKTTYASYVSCWRCTGTTWNHQESPHKRHKGLWTATCKSCGVVEGGFRLEVDRPTEAELTEAHQKFLSETNLKK